MKKTVKVGIIGCGVIAPSHIESYQLDPNVKVVWACDLVKAKADAIADKYGIPKRTTSAAEVFADPSVDAVSVCTSHYTHADLCVQALAAGKDVICEKALTGSPADLAKMLKAADAHPDRIFAGIFQHRYNPIFQCLHGLVAKGAFGKPISAAMQHRGLRTPAYYDSGDWRGTWDKEGGGVLINQAIHYLDLFQWVMGGVRDVEAFFTNATLRKSIETEDTIVGAVRFRNGALGTVEATNAAFVPWETTLEITGTDGAVEIRDGQIRKNAFRDPAFADELVAAHEAASRKIAGKIGKSHYGYGHPIQIADFVKSVRTRKPPFVTVRVAAEAPALVMKFYKAARQNSPKGPGGRKSKNIKDPNGPIY